jgi:hypothetical protein
MEIVYTVNRVSNEPAKVLAKVGDEEMQVITDRLIVELIDSTGQHGTATLRFTGQAIVEAKQKFVVGQLAPVWTI